MDQESRATTHVIGGSWIQIVAVVHALESAHVTQGVGSLRKRSDADLALARWVVAARARLAGAAAGGVNP